MISIDLSGKAVLITGGTKGIGLAAGLSFGRAGAHCYLTHRWGSADEAAIVKQFTDAGAPAPTILQADVSNADDTKALYDEIEKQHPEGVHVFVSNVGFALVATDLNEIKLKSFQRTMEYSAWPLLDYVKRHQKKFNRWPRYTLAISSFGPDNFYPGYDLVAASKAVMETWVRYLGTRLSKDKCNVIGVRLGMVATESFRATFGDEFTDKALRITPEKFVPLEQCGDVMLGLCSGLMDGVNGQTVIVDGATSNNDNLITMSQDPRFQLYPNEG